MPALPRNTYKTPHGFQPRLVVLDDLRQLIGKREIKRSLGKDFTAAGARPSCLPSRSTVNLMEPPPQVSARVENSPVLKGFAR